MSNVRGRDLGTFVSKYDRRLNARSPSRLGIPSYTADSLKIRSVQPEG